MKLVNVNRRHGDARAGSFFPTAVLQLRSSWNDEYSRAREERVNF